MCDIIDVENKYNYKMGEFTLMIFL